MSDFDDLRLIRLHYESRSKRDHTVPVYVLVKSLQHVQRIVYLLAKCHQGDDSGLRGRISHNLEQRFVLNCRVPEAGSYALPIEIGNASISKFDALEIATVCRLFRRLSRALHQGDNETLCRNVSDANTRTALMKAYRGSQPPKKSGIVLSIEDHKNSEIVDGFRIGSAIDKMETRNFVVDVGHLRITMPAYVTGTLVAMNFAKRRLQLELQKGQVLNATYSDDFEPDLLDRPRGIVHLHGQLEYDDRGTLVALTDVDAILSVDESPIIVGELNIDDTCYLADPPLSFKVTFDRKDLLYDLEGDFGIMLSGLARPDLEQILRNELELLWNEYAKEKSSRLSAQARKLRKNLRERFRNAGQIVEHGA